MQVVLGRTGTRSGGFDVVNVESDDNLADVENEESEPNHLVTIAEVLGSILSNKVGSDEPTGEDQRSCNAELNSIMKFEPIGVSQTEASEECTDGKEEQETK